ncbi:hypothetical protein EYZ11_012236 [Aspergillus tanneri]|uniref:Uncharacterized protein n=1 Tax=Aspergillus tanneri TaxID=1220188 RepID=A0A4S3J2V5_9EURO|nr:hypothetical protein EYZ11_012236 [Aspergillus tanneri]
MWSTFALLDMIGSHTVGTYTIPNVVVDNPVVIGSMAPILNGRWICEQVDCAPSFLWLFGHLSTPPWVSVVQVSDLSRVSRCFNPRYEGPLIRHARMRP